MTSMLISTNRTPTESAVYALLDLISNPKSDAYKAALDELVTARVAAEGAVAKANALDASNIAAASDLKTKSEALAKAVIAHTQAAADLKVMQEKHAADVAAAQAQIIKQNDALKAADVALKARTAIANDFDTKLRAREDAIAPREAAAEQKAAQAQAIIKRASALVAG